MRAFLAGGPSDSMSSLSVAAADAPGRFSLIRPGFERSTTFWKALGAGLGAGAAAGASPSDSESEYAIKFMVLFV